MTLKVTIQPKDHQGGAWPVYYTEDDGVYVGPNGELQLVAGSSEETGDPNEFRIYAPGTWKEVNVEQIND
jgi:hypothetical protein